VLAEIQHLLSLRGLEPGQLAGVSVTIGPGPFSGLRVGLSVAKGFALGLDLPIVGVPTLAAAALPFAGLGIEVMALVPAGRGRLVWSLLGSVGGELGEVTPPRNGTLAELIEALPASGQVIVTGELNSEQAVALSALAQVRLAPVALRARRPAAVAAIGWDRLQRGEADDPASLQAIYAGRD
jgi:tRNA threonylcarbamoyladenosine biosynthesis protein TsaB